jgi:hypothetical protein
MRCVFMPNLIASCFCSFAHTHFLQHSSIWKRLRVALLQKKNSSPTTCHEGAWGERRYSFYSFLTSALDGGEWLASRLGRALAPRKGPPVPIVQEAGWTPEPVWTEARGKILSPLPGIEPRSRCCPARSQTLY